MHEAVRGGDDVASRMGIAAAAAVVASGLFVGGSSASLAFAGPDSEPAGNTGGTQSTGTPGGATGAPSGTPEADPTAVVPGSGELAPGAQSEAPQKPPTQVGDGRNGLEVGEPDPTPELDPSSKLPDPTTEASPQANPTDAGEQDSEAGTLPSGGEPEDAEAEQGDPGDDAAALPTDPTTEPEAAPVATPEGIPDGTDAGVGAKIAGAENDEEEHPGWPFPCWWPFPDVGQPPGNDGGGGGVAQLPIRLPFSVPPMQLPLPTDLLDIPGQALEQIFDTVTGLATAAAELPFIPISLPVIVIPPLGAPAGPGIGGGGAGAGGVAAPRPAPTGVMPNTPPITGSSGSPPAAPPRIEPKSPNAEALSTGSGSAPAPSYRAGYGDFLRAAGLGEVAAVAVPGLTGILVLTGAGGLLGYRQARAGHTVRASGRARFMG